MMLRFHIDFALSLIRGFLIHLVLQIASNRRASALASCGSVALQRPAIGCLIADQQPFQPPDIIDRDLRTANDKQTENAQEQNTMVVGVQLATASLAVIAWTRPISPAG